MATKTPKTKRSESKTRVAPSANRVTERERNDNDDVLARLVREIKDALNRAAKANQERLTYYRSAGDGLNAAKKLEAHGDWKEWLKDNFHLSIRQAQKYMKFAEAPRKALLDPSPYATLKQEEELWREASGAPKNGEPKKNKKPKTSDDDANTGDDGSVDFIPTLTKEEDEKYSPMIQAIIDEMGKKSSKEAVLFAIEREYARPVYSIKKGARCA